MFGDENIKDKMLILHSQQGTATLNTRTTYVAHTIHHVRAELSIVPSSVSNQF